MMTRSAGSGHSVDYDDTPRQALGHDDDAFERAGLSENGGISEYATPSERVGSSEPIESSEHTAQTISTTEHAESSQRGDSSEHVGPSESTGPTMSTPQDVETSQHAEPSDPVEPSQRDQPLEYEGPSEHTKTPEPAEPVEPAEPSESTGPTMLTPQDVEASQRAEPSEYAEPSGPTGPTMSTPQDAESSEHAEHSEPAGPTMPVLEQQGPVRTPAETTVIPQEEEHVPRPGSPIYNDESELPGDSKHTFAQAFPIEKPKVNDLWAGLLLILTFSGFAVVSGITIRKYAMNMSIFGLEVYDTVNTFSLNTNTMALFSFVLCSSFLVSWGYFVSARAFTTQFIWATGILNIVLALGTAVYLMIKRQWGGGVTFLFFGFFAIVCFASWIPRIPFSVMILQTTMDVARGQGRHVFMVSALGGLTATAFAGWFSATLVAIYVAFGPGSGASSPLCINGHCSPVMLVGLMSFVTFAGYWITEWIKNTIHTAVAGVYGSWYFFSSSAAGIPRGATRGALRRAVTYSFGSISFGSLGIAIINTFRQLFSVVRYRATGTGVCGLLGSIMWCLGGCALAVLDWLTTFFNRYAFCHVALYGKAFIPAAKDTWGLMRDRGIDALINDSLVSPVLSMGSIFVGYLCALLSYLFLQVTTPAYNQGGEFTPAILGFAFISGLQVCQIFLTPLGSGADTIFVAMAWDPQIAVKDHPELWGRVVDVYPKVQSTLRT